MSRPSIVTETESDMTEQRLILTGKTEKGLVEKTAFFHTDSHPESDVARI